jgi:type I restriction enzyme S subunit
MMWPQVKLREVVAKLASGARPKGGAVSSGVFSIGAEHLDGTGGFDLSKGKYIPLDFYNSIGSGKIKYNDVLIVKDGATTGKVSIVEENFPLSQAAVNEHVFRLELDNLKIEPKFCFYYLMSSQGQKEILSDFRGATVGGISKSILDKIQIPLPPLPVQQRIAAILDAADALRRKDQELLKKYDELAQAIFIDMFGDPVKNEKGWEVKKLNQIAILEDHLRVPIESSVRMERKGPYDYYGASGVIDKFDDYIFDGTRLLIGEDGANLLARSSPIAFLAHGKYWVNNHAHVLKSDNLDLLKYLEYWFNSISLRPYITGSAQPKLNGGALNRIPIPVPPHHLLTGFSLKIESINKQVVQIAHSNGLFQALMQKAFNSDLFG